MEITSTEEYMELVLGAKSIEKIKPGDWTLIEINAKEGLKFDIELLEAKKKLDTTKKILHVPEQAKNIDFLQEPIDLTF